MSEKVLGFYEKDANAIIKYNKKKVVYTIFKLDFVPVVSVKKVEKMIKQRPCKSCKYFTDWLKELKVSEK